jgi:hypothetical protein
MWWTARVPGIEVPVSEPKGPGCAKTKSGRAEDEFLSFFALSVTTSLKNSGCGYTAQSFHTAWVVRGIKPAHLRSCAQVMRRGLNAFWRIKFGASLRLQEV